jgi:hypothetical protein
LALEVGKGYERQNYNNDPTQTLEVRHDH